MEYGLIGEKLGHSYSKQIHEEFGNYTYDLLELQKEQLDSFLKDRAFKGINVTIPYKQDVIPYLDQIDPKAEAIGAVNTIVNKDGKLHGYNTDYYGLTEIIKHAGYDLGGKKVLILGTGGTSRTAAFVCADLGAGSICRVSRKVREDAGELPLANTNTRTITYKEAIEQHPDADLIINTTPSGMYPNMEQAPVDLAPFTDLQGVIDVIYNPLRTRLLLQAEAMGIRADGGLRMLVYQAVHAYRLFTGLEPDKERAEEILKKIRMERENIVLIGMPGSGKSTIGKLLSAKLGMEFVDTDALIVSREGRSIPDIFATEGEAYFRKLEAEVAKELGTKNRLVIATGGGLILNPACEEAFKAYGRLFFLNRDPKTIRPTKDRPLADDHEKIAKLYEERFPKYKKAADVVIPVQGAKQQTAELILKQC